MTKSSMAVVFFVFLLPLLTAGSDTSMPTPNVIKGVGVTKHESLFDSPTNPWVDAGQAFRIAQDQRDPTPAKRRNRISKWQCACVVNNGGTQYYEACTNSQKTAQTKANAKCELHNSGWNACKCSDCHEVGFCE